MRSNVPRSRSSGPPSTLRTRTSSCSSRHGGPSTITTGRTAPLAAALPPSVSPSWPPRSQLPRRSRPPRPQPEGQLRYQTTSYRWLPTSARVRGCWDNRRRAHVGADEGTYPIPRPERRPWAILAPPLKPATRRGRPRLHDRRLVLDAIFYVLRGGIASAAPAEALRPTADRLRPVPALAARRPVVASTLVVEIRWAREVAIGPAG